MPRSPRRIRAINLNTNHVYTFEALLIAADAYKRAGSTDPKALADAIRTTNIKDNVSIGPGIQFDAKGQNDKLWAAAIQNRGGKLVDRRAKGSGQCQAGMAAEAIRQARLTARCPRRPRLRSPLDCRRPASLCVA